MGSQLSKYFKTDPPLPGTLAEQGDNVHAPISLDGQI